MINNRTTVHIQCGEKGSGKTTFVKQKWRRHLFIACGDPVNQIKTTGALFFALEPIYDTVTDDLWNIVKHLRKVLKDGYVLIIDEAENINEALLKTIVNTALSNTDSTIVFTFDVDCESLYKSKIFRQLIEWDFVPSKTLTNYCAGRDQFAILIKNAIPDISEEMISELIETSNYNFNNLKRLLWLVVNKQTDLKSINDDVISEYSYFLVEEKLSSLPKDLSNLLRKSSVIGKMFQSCILESPDGFHVLGVKTYLKKLEATNLFIQSYLCDDVYQFVSNRIYTGVLKSIEPHEKIESQQILLRYYMAKLTSELKDDRILDYLRQLKRLSYELNDHETMFFTDKRLLFLYLKIGDIAKARIVLTDLLVFCKEYMDDKMLHLFLSFYKIRLDMRVGCFNDALDGIHIIQQNYSNDINLYLQYYNARSLYGIGDVDHAYTEALKLEIALKATSSKAAENQPIYALTYSLLATLQHHFGIEDYGMRYYILAMNHSKYKLEDKSIHYGILKKCDMYYGFELSYPLLEQSISYFEAAGKVYDAAEVYLNLATEMMFNDSNYNIMAETLFEKATKTFTNIPNENLAYVQNNWALLNIIQYGNFKKALLLLENSFLVGMSAFTYMTLYLNLCMCHLALYGSDSSEFNQAYKEFCKHYSTIKAREKSTQYEDVYKGILDILILEHRQQTQEVVERISLLLLNAPSQFFLPILEDIKIRNTQQSKREKDYSDNHVFYRAINKHRIFLAEFRFWE